MPVYIPAVIPNFERYVIDYDYRNIYFDKLKLYSRALWANTTNWINANFRDIDMIYRKKLSGKKIFVKKLRNEVALIIKFNVTRDVQAGK